MTINWQKKPRRMMQGTTIRLGDHVEGHLSMSVTQSDDRSYYAWNIHNGCSNDHGSAATEAEAIAACETRANIRASGDLANYPSQHLGGTRRFLR